MCEKCAWCKEIIPVQNGISFVYGTVDGNVCEPCWDEWGDYCTCCEKAFHREELYILWNERYDPNEEEEREDYYIEMKLIEKYGDTAELCDKCLDNERYKISEKNKMRMLLF